jgi:hypothetical protein
MNNKQIERAMRSNAVTRANFRGCYAANRIPLPVLRERKHYPHSIVVNTQPFPLSGEHWVAVHVVSPEKVEYYDSFADWPPPWHIAKRLEQLVPLSEITRNRVPLQSEKSGACGPHVLNFLRERARGRSLSAIVGHLHRPKSTPDSLARARTRYHFNNIYN